MGVRAHSVTAAVDPKIVWERWTDPDLWVTDDPLLAKAKLNGPLAKGAVGMVRTTRGARSAFKIVEVDRQQMRFVTESKLALATVTIERELTRPEVDADPVGGADAPAEPVEVDPNLRVLTHRIIIKGPLAKLWDRLIGKRMSTGLPEQLANITAVAALED